MALPPPWPRGDGKFYNSLLIIDGSGEIAYQLNKVGFQKGEDKLFVAKLGAEDMVAINLLGKEIIKTESLLPN